MKKCFIFSFLFVFAAFCFSQQIAVIEGNGRKVILSDDGTWKYYEDASEESLENVFQRMLKALQAQSIEKFEALCTPGYWGARTDSGERFYRQATRKKFDLVLAGQDQNKDRIVCRVNVLRDGKQVDMVYILFVKKEKTWLMDGITENRNHVKHFKNGAVSGHFSPQDLPSLPELQKIAMLMMESSKKPESEEKLFADFFTADHSNKKHIGNIKTKQLSYKSNHYSLDLKKGVIIFDYEEEGPKGPSTGNLNVYMKQVEQKWCIYRTGTWGVYASDFLED